MPAFGKTCLILLIIYSLFILYSTTLPFDLTTAAETVRHNIHSIRWTPLVRPDGSRESIPDVASNLLLFVPLGVLIGLVTLSMRGKGSWLKALWFALAGSALLSALVESVQILSISRVTSVTDLCTNAIGGLSGGLLSVLSLLTLKKPLRRWHERKGLPSPEMLLLAVYVTALFLSYTIPFDISLDIGHIKAGLKSALLDPFSDPTPPSKMLGNALWMAGLSFLLCFVLCRQAPFRRSRDGRMLAVLVAVAGSTGLTIFLEILQIFIGSRVAATRDILAGLGGAVYGALLFVLLKPPVLSGGQAPPQRGRSALWEKRIFWLMVIHYLLFLAHGALYPYIFSRPEALTDSIARALVPFASYYGKTNALALFDFLGGIVRFTPLGFLLQGYGRVHRRSRKGTTILICVLLGGVLEGLQLTVAGRYADSSDIIAAGCGGYAGWWVWRWWRGEAADPRAHRA
jgi:glycopeptide antibiotics resistance protein